MGDEIPSLGVFEWPLEALYCLHGLVGILQCCIFSWNLDNRSRITNLIQSEMFLLHSSKQRNIFLPIKQRPRGIPIADLSHRGSILVPSHPSGTTYLFINIVRRWLNITDTFGQLSWYKIPKFEKRLLLRVSVAYASFLASHETNLGLILMVPLIFLYVSSASTIFFVNMSVSEDTFFDEWILWYHDMSLNAETGKWCTCGHRVNGFFARSGEAKEQHRTLISLLEE